MSIIKDYDKVKRSVAQKEEEYREREISWEKLVLASSELVIKGHEIKSSNQIQMCNKKILGDSIK